jgi:hypothetical protein
MRTLILMCCLCVAPSFASAQVANEVPLSIHCSDWFTMLHNTQADVAGIKENQRAFDACTEKLNKNPNDPCAMQPIPYDTTTHSQDLDLGIYVSKQLLYSGPLMQLLGLPPDPNAMSDSAPSVFTAPNGTLGAYGIEISNICTQSPSIPLAYATAEAFGIVEATYEGLTPPSGEFLMNAVTQWLGPMP